MWPGISYPLWFLIPLLLMGLLALSPQSKVLPGNWTDLIVPSLQGFLGGGVTTHDRKWRLIPMCILWMLMAAALATVTFGHTQIQEVRNLQGRVIVLDMGSSQLSERQVALARQLLGQTQGVPTAIVAVTSRAFVVVPLTTDHRHIDRYLQVLDSAVMPVDGQLPWRGLEKAATLLSDNEVLAGQIVLFTGSSPPSDALLTTLQIDGDVQPFLIVDSSIRDRWRKYAGRINARLVDPTEFDAIDEDLEQRRERIVIDTGSIRQRRDLTPWMIGLCLVLWLVLFFRRENA